MTPIYGDRGRSETYGDASCMCCRRRSSTTPGCHVPPGLSFVSGLNVIAHAAEGLYAHGGNPIISLMAEDGIRALATGLRGIKNEPQAW